MGEIVIEEKRSKAFKLVFAGFFMFAASLALWAIGISDQVFFYKLIGCMASVFFFIAFIAALIRAMKKKPLLVIKGDGIIESSSASSIGFVSYDEIEKFEVVNIYGQKVIGILPKDNEEFIKKLPRNKQRAANMNIKMSFPPASIRVDTAKDMTIEDIYSLLQKRLKDYTSFY
ncbi:MAG: hypothetical protein E7256_03530 [Lachnospiraceae bacterium]|nr:hypothetical protein [Lachnospiraceae bacterium]